MKTKPLSLVSLLSAAGAFAVLSAPVQAAYTITSFGPGAWGSSDAALGLNAASTIEEKNGTAAPQFVPRAFVNWQASSSDTFRAGYARAWQQRNLFDLYGDVRAYDPVSHKLLAEPYIANPDLRVSKVDTVELGYLGRFPTLDSTIDVRVFNERITDFVIRKFTSSPSPVDLPLPSSQFTNLASPVVLRGLEYQFRARPAVATELLFSHTLISRHSDDPAVVKRTSPYAASLTWLQRYGAGWSSTASLLRMGSLAGGYGYVPGFDYTSAPYTTLDLRIARNFQLEGRKAEVALNANNVGKGHQEIADRSEQFLHSGGAVNPVTPMVWMSFFIEL